MGGWRQLPVLALITIIYSYLFTRSHAAVFHLPIKKSRGSLWCPVSIGTPPQTVQVQVDTESTHLWVLGKSSEDNLGKDYEHMFYNGQSTSKKEYRAKWWQRKKKKTLSVDYCDGDIFTGEMILDTIKLDTATPPLKHISLAVVESVRVQNDVSLMDGIMGLSPFVYKENPNKSTPFLLQLLQAGKLDESLLSIYLPGKLKGTGELSLGGVNDLRFKGGKINYFPVRQNGNGKYNLWSLTLDSVHLGGGGGGAKREGGSSTKERFGKEAAAIIKSRTSHIYVPNPFFHKIVTSSGASWLELGGGVRYPVIKCSDRGKLDDLVFTIGGIEFRFTGEDYFRMLFPGLCVLQLEGVDSPVWILGKPFLRKFYTVLNWGKKEIGFAEANHANVPGDGGVKLATPVAYGDSNMTTNYVW